MTKPAAAHEALSESIPFEYNGEKFDLAPTSEWTYDVLEAYEEGRMSGFLKGILGEDQHDRFRDMRLKVRELETFFSEVQKALGLSGN